MSGQRTVQWVLILIALALLVVLIRQRQSAVETVVEVPTPLRKGDGARINRIERNAGPVDLILEREDGRWKLREPVADLASERMVRGLLRHFEEPGIQRTLESGDSGAFGLDPPRGILRFRFRNGRELEIAIGDATPSGESVYASWTGLGKVAIVPKYVANRYYETDLLYWREREPLPPLPSQIDSVWVSWPGERARIRRHDRESWELLAPADRVADGLACARAVASFWRFPFDRFFDDARPLAELGLDAPAAVWIIHRAGRRDTLAIGARTESHQMVLQLRGRAPGLVRDDPYTVLTGGLSQLEDRRLYRLDGQEPRLMTVSRGREGWVFLRRRGEWWGRRVLPTEGGAMFRDDRPDTTAGSFEPLQEPSMTRDLSELLRLRADAWVERAVSFAETDVFQTQLWTDDGTLRWVRFLRRAAYDDTTHVRCSHSPQRLLKTGSPVVAGWFERLGRVSSN